LNTYERIFVRGDAQDDKITHNVIFSPISFRRTKRNREKNPEKKKRSEKKKPINFKVVPNHQPQPQQQPRVDFQV